MLETRNMITEMKNAFKGIASRLKEKTGEFEDRSMPISQTRMQRERKKIQENIKKNCGTIFKSVANITGCQKDKKETRPEDEFEGKIATTFQRRRKLREPHADPKANEPHAKALPIPTTAKPNHLRSQRVLKSSAKKE